MAEGSNYINPSYFHQSTFHLSHIDKAISCINEFSRIRCMLWLIGLAHQLLNKKILKNMQCVLLAFVSIVDYTHLYNRRLRIIWAAYLVMFIYV